VGLSVFAFTGASKAMGFGIGPAQAMILGVVTAVGGGTLRDALVGQVPTVMRKGLYAIPALVGAAITVVGILVGFNGLLTAVVAAMACFLIRIIGLWFKLDAPKPRGVPDHPDPPGRD
jgi:uncharacterized membrane protein YeiH